jgi:hypothetical protein
MGLLLLLLGQVVHLVVPFASKSVQVPTTKNAGKRPPADKTTPHFHITEKEAETYCDFTCRRRDDCCQPISHPNWSKGRMNAARSACPSPNILTNTLGHPETQLTESYASRCSCCPPPDPSHLLLHVPGSHPPQAHLSPALHTLTHAAVHLYLPALALSVCFETVLMASALVKTDGRTAAASPGQVLVYKGVVEHQEGGEQLPTTCRAAWLCQHLSNQKRPEGCQGSESVTKQ